MKLFEPITIRGTTFKNRIVYAPMNVGLGLTGTRPRVYFVERAKGGAGAIITPGTSVDTYSSDEAWGKPGGVQSFIERLPILTDEVHQYGAKIGMQLLHMNRLPMGLLMSDTSGDLVAPSPDPEEEPPVPAGAVPRQRQGPVLALGPRARAARVRGRSAARPGRVGGPIGASPAQPLVRAFTNAVLAQKSQGGGKSRRPGLGKSRAAA